MVYYRGDVGDVFSALADPTRRAILERLRSGPRRIGELAEPFDMSLPAVSKHVRVLNSAGLVAVRREGRARVCQLEAGRLRDGQEWLERFRAFWDAELDQVERYLSGSAEATADDQRERGND